MPTTLRWDKESPIKVFPLSPKGLSIGQGIGEDLLASVPLNSPQRQLETKEAREQQDADQKAPFRKHRFPAEKDVERFQGPNRTALSSNSTSKKGLPVWTRDIPLSPH